VSAALKEAITDLDGVISYFEGITARIHDVMDSKEIQDEIWNAYLKVETMVAILKLRLGIERPGKFITSSKRDDINEFITSSLSNLYHARDMARKEHYEEVFELLREARNGLRAYLSASRKMNIKKQAKKAAIS
jgi:hypothetical protein